jgi:elongation factor G
LTEIAGQLRSVARKSCPTGTTFSAKAPLGEMLRYATHLRSITSGRGIYTMEFSRYQETPTLLQEAIVEQRKVVLSKRAG